MMNTSEATKGVWDLLEEEGWDDVAETAISDWCAKNWSSSVPSDVAAEVVAGALLKDSEFLADAAEESINLDDVDWVKIGENVLEVMIDRAHP